MSTSNLILIPLKNREGAHVKLDKKIFDVLSADPHLSAIRLFDKLRQHSSGYAVFQRSVSTRESLTFETIYLHKLVAERFLTRPEKAPKRLFVHMKDGDKLNCCVDNLEYVNMGQLRRSTKAHNSQAGYRGVVFDGKKFRAIIYIERKPLSLGFFKTAEEAAEAYNQKSIELFGETPSLNTVKRPIKPQ